ncbi:MAG: aminodeoxychorismate synthase, component I, partial [Acidimicrobiia bacterium]|nr:aminodeoxychorismate synthase, component I [Acidimicrobiia bacterium]
LATASGALPRFATGIQDADEVTVELAGTAVQPHDRMLFHKTTDRTTYDLAMSEVTSQEALLTNAYGEITESTISNVVLMLDGIWFTPPLESGCLPGVYRQHLLEQGQIVERVLRREDLLSSEMIGLVNSVRGWRRALLA